MENTKNLMTVTSSSSFMIKGKSNNRNPMKVQKLSNMINITKPATSAKPIKIITKTSSNNRNNNVPAFKSMIRKLSWDEFKGKPSEDAFWMAYTFWNYSYSYTISKIPNSNQVKIQLKARCDLSPKSWVRYPSDELLKHEQGHYDLGVLCMLDFKKRVMDTMFYNDTYKEKINSIYNEVVKEYKQKNLDYDHETGHFLNTEKQKLWEQLIQKQLNDFSQYERM